MIKFSVTTNEKEYRDFEEHACFSNLLQSYDWAKVKNNWEHVYYIGKDENNRTVATALALIKRLPLGYGMMYIPRGPVMASYYEPDLTEFVKFIQEDARKRKVVFAKLDTPLTDKDYVGIFTEAGMIHQGYTTVMKETIQPRLNSIVYEKPDWEQNLPKHTKRLIKDADKQNIEIVFGKAELLDDLVKVVSMTEDRKDVHLRDRGYFEKLMNTFKEDAVITIAYLDIDERLETTEKTLADLNTKLENINPKANKKKKTLEDQIKSQEKYLARYNALKEKGISGKQAIAGILSIKHNRNYEMLYAGMDTTFKEFMPQYKQYVENFKYAFEKLDCVTASMGGIEFDDNDGLKKFKRNFNPEEVEYIGEFNIPVNKLLYPIMNWLYTKKKNG